MKTVKPRLNSLIFFLILSFIFIISCDNKLNKKNTERYFTTNLESEPETLDPQLIKDVSGYVLADKLYEGLVRLDENSEIIPAGAESWTVSEDGKYGLLVSEKERNGQTEIL